jgi:hypothetical protein
MSKKSKKEKAMKNSKVADTDTDNEKPEETEETDGEWDDLDDLDEDSEDIEDEVDDSDGSEDEDEPEDDQDDTDEVVPPQYYTVVNGFSLDGEDYQPGQKIEVKCRFCAMWNTPLAAKGGKPMCYPGLKTSFNISDDETAEWRMQEDRFSCQQHFVPLDIPEVVQYFKADADDVAALKFALPIATAITNAQTKFEKYIEKSNIDATKADELLDTINSFAHVFTTSEQIEYVRPLISFLLKKLRAKQRRQGAAPGRRASFVAGDEVLWTGRNGQELRGLVLKAGGPKKTITLMVQGKTAEVLYPKQVAQRRQDDPNARVAFKYEVLIADFNTMNPKVTSEAMMVAEEVE